MKKNIFLSILLWCLLALAACGQEAEKESLYYEIRVEAAGQLKEPETGQFLLGQQYYQGEPVNLISEQGETADVMDVYICPMEGDKQLLMSGVSRQHRVRGWYLDDRGRCFVRKSTGITRLDEDGSLLYHSPLSDLVTDMCCTKNGRVILLTQKTNGRSLVELDPDTGDTTPIENVSQDMAFEGINSLGNDLALLTSLGVWQIDLKTGTKLLKLPFTGTLYTLEVYEGIADFRLEGNRIDILWDTGRAERLEQTEVNSTKEIIIVRSAYPDPLKKPLNLFNQSNDSYFAVLEELEPNRDNMLTGDSQLEDFQTDTNLRLASGKGADIICSDALYDVSGLMEKGVFADLAPMMEASGIREEDYFRTAFDAWRDGDKVYGIMPHMYLLCNTLEKAVLNDSTDLTIESFLDSLLAFGEDRRFYASWDGTWILDYFLKGSENLFGMVDWEKGTCDFSGELFSKMLLAAKRYGADEVQRQYPEILGYRNIRLYNFDLTKKLDANNQVEMGYFFDDGNYPLSPVYDGNQIIMGINAESEHIEGAWQLLVFLLSEEAQSTMDIYTNFLFPTNKNVFDRLAQAELEYGVTVESEHNGKVHTAFIPGRNGQVVMEESVVELRRLLSDARTLPYKTEPLRAIITEETAYYFNGAKTMEEVVSLVQNRVQLYLNEHKTIK